MHSRGSTLQNVCYRLYAAQIRFLASNVLNSANVLSELRVWWDQTSSSCRQSSKTECLSDYFILEPFGWMISCYRPKIYLFFTLWLFVFFHLHTHLLLLYVANILLPYSHVRLIAKTGSNNPNWPNSYLHIQGRKALVNSFLSVCMSSYMWCFINLSQTSTEAWVCPSRHDQKNVWESTAGGWCNLNSYLLLLLIPVLIKFKGQACFCMQLKRVLWTSSLLQGPDWTKHVSVCFLNRFL